MISSSTGRTRAAIWVNSDLAGWVLRVSSEGIPSILWITWASELSIVTAWPSARRVPVMADIKLFEPNSMTRTYRNCVP